MKKSRYSNEEISKLTEEIAIKYHSHCNSTYCQQCIYHYTDNSCVLMFALDYLNKKGMLDL